jgi:hypothetical protein
MLATVTIETGYEVSDENAKGRKNEIAPPLAISGAKGFQTFHALIDIRRSTNMLEIVKRCRPTTVGASIEAFMSDIHFKMLNHDCVSMVITPLKAAKDVYQLKCRKHKDKNTGVTHSLTVTVQAISVPRLDDRDMFLWTR